MKDDFSLLHDIFDEYKVADPLPGEAQDFIVANEKRTLVDILKKLGRYNFFLGLVISVFYFFKKIGIGLSIVQSAVVVVTASSVAAASVATGAYVGVQYISKEEAPPEIKIEKKIEDTGTLDSGVNPEKEKNTTDTQVVTTPKKPAKVFENTIAVKSFGSESLDIKEANRVSGILKNEFARLRGSGNSLSSSGPKPDFVILGSIEKTGDAYTLSARVVNKNGSVIESPSVKLDSLNDIKRTCKKMARNISAGIK
ncbi:MAG: hypothetical protein GY754_12590 [bacterium]|nr:hypothetical protein [bacterium]